MQHRIEHRRNGNKHRGLMRTSKFKQLGWHKSSRVHRQASAGEWQECQDRQSKAVELRQHTKHDVLLIKLCPFKDLLHVLGKVGIREHHALRPPTSAARVEDDHGVIGRSRLTKSNRRNASESHLVQTDDFQARNRATNQVKHRPHSNDRIKACIFGDVLQVAAREQVVERHRSATGCPDTKERRSKHPGGGQQDAHVARRTLLLHRARQVPGCHQCGGAGPGAEVVHSNRSEGAAGQAPLNLSKEWHVSCSGRIPRVDTIHSCEGPPPNPMHSWPHLLG